MIIKFNKFERDTIKAIISFNGQDISGFIAERILYDRVIQMDSDKLIYLFKGVDISPANELFELLALLNYLEKNNLIFIHLGKTLNKGNILTKNLRFNHDKSKLLNERDEIYENFTRFDIPTELTDVLKRYTQAFFYVSSELKYLVDENFETIETKQLNEAKSQTEKINVQLIVSKKQTKYSMFAFYISLIALIFTILYSGFFKSTIKLDNEQFDILLEQKVEKDKKDELLNNTLSKNDNVFVDSLTIDSLKDSILKTKRSKISNHIQKTELK